MRFGLLRKSAHFATVMMFPGALLAVLYFALVSNVRRDVLSILPDPVRQWCGHNDDWSNVLIFGLLAFLGLRIGPVKRYAMGRLIGLLGLVLVLEVAQRWIPGRFSSARDLVTGWAGVLGVWLLMQLYRRVKFADQQSRMKSS